MIPAFVVHGNFHGEVIRHINAPHAGRRHWKIGCGCNPDVGDPERLHGAAFLRGAAQVKETRVMYPPFPPGLAVCTGPQLRILHRLAHAESACR